MLLRHLNRFLHIESSCKGKGRLLLLLKSSMCNITAGKNMFYELDLSPLLCGVNAASSLRGLHMHF